MQTQIEVEWSKVWKEEWGCSNCLYAYLHPENNEILYIGKAYGTTVGQRFIAAEKEDLFDYFEKELGIGEEDLHVIVGEIVMEKGWHLSNEFLADIESLLISCIQPLGNIKGPDTRISHLGMVVCCTGPAWHHERMIFVDQ
jgi:hypothetical protein